jgi:hypothetical protein
MANPNILNVTSLYGKSTGLLLTTSTQDIVTATTNKVFKINSIFGTNVTSDNSNTSLTVIFYDSSTGTSSELCSLSVIPAYNTLVALDKDSSIYLEEGDKIQARADKANAIKLTISWEEIS